MANQGNKKSQLALIIPCFNETHRLVFDFFVQAQNYLNCILIFVDDGSSDETSKKILDKLSFLGEKAKVLTLPSNIGKSKAMKEGLAEAIRINVKFAIFCDADNSNSLIDLSNIYKKMQNRNDIDIISSARVPLSGMDVKRKDYRKWIGRIIATIVSKMTRLKIYDPMSPLKIYKLASLSDLTLYRPKTRWLGEVELLLHIYQLKGKDFVIEEICMSYWRDQDGGHVGLKSIFILLRDFLVLRKFITKNFDKEREIHEYII